VTSTLDALQTALAAEHAVIWGYAVIGGRIGPVLRPEVADADAEHRGRRDATALAVRKLGGDPAPTHASYALPYQVTDRSSALRLAVHLEEGSAAAWRFVVASATEVSTKRVALAALTDAAVRATKWRKVATPKAPTVAFPGQTG
jgi:Domain of unknown function (DUF4439)